MDITRPTRLEISEKNFLYNVSQIKKYIGENIEIMPVIKANGYGTWINKNMKLMESFKIIAVANVDEAVQMRNLGFQNKIFVLNEPYKDEIEKILKYNISVGISDESFIEELKNVTKKINIHIEIETGMGRTGVNLNNLSKIISMLEENKNINVEGIYTHLSSADVDIEYTNMQLNEFKEAIKITKEKFPKLKYIHALASNGILNFKIDECNLVRPGIILYGYKSFEGTYSKIDIKPIATLKSKVIFLKEVPKGTAIGYSKSFITQKEKSVIATIPIGYADGLRRVYAKKGEVIVNGMKAKIVGNICMDSFMIDVTSIPNVEVGTDVYIWDNNIISLDDVAKKCDTINYEILSTISERVPRIFVEE